MFFRGVRLEQELVSVGFRVRPHNIAPQIYLIHSSYNSRIVTLNGLDYKRKIESCIHQYIDLNLLVSKILISKQTLHATQCLLHECPHCTFLS